MSNNKDIIFIELFIDGEFESFELECIDDQTYWEEGGVRIRKYTLPLENATSVNNVSLANHILSDLRCRGHEMVGFGVHRNKTSWYYQIRDFVS